jgi:hypothetical protein
MVRLLLKSFILILLFCFGCSKCKQSEGTSNAQYLPTGQAGTEGSAATAFKQRFPKAQDVSWDSVENGLVANFFDGTYESEAFFDFKGQYQYLTTSIDFETLPKAIQDFIQKKYSVEELAFIQKMEDAKEKIYHVELKTDKEYINLDFDLTGKLKHESKLPLSNEELQSEEEEGVEK